MTNETGDLVSTEAQAAVRKTAHHVYREMDAFPDMKPIATWDNNATQYHRNWLRHELEVKHSFLKLCSDGWKSHQVGIETFPTYRQNHPLSDNPKGRSLTVKPEDDDDDDLDKSALPAKGAHKRKADLDIDSLEPAAVQTQKMKHSSTPVTPHGNTATKPANPL